MNLFPLIDIQLDRGTATNQIPVWNDTTKRFVPSVSLTGITLASPWTLSGDGSLTGTLQEITANDSNKFVLLGTKMWSFASTLGNNIFTISSTIVASTPIFQATGGIKIPAGEFIGTTTDLTLMQLIDGLVTIDGDLRSGHIGVDVAPVSTTQILAGGTMPVSITSASIASATLFDPTATIASLAGIRFVIQLTSSNETVTKLSGGQGVIGTTNTYGGAIPDARCFEAAGVIRQTAITGADIGNWVDYYAANPIFSPGIPAWAADIDKCYGIFIENITAGTTENWAIFSAGGNSSHAGNFRIGDNVKPILGALEVEGVSFFGDPEQDFSTFEADGTLRFNNAATVFNDIFISLSSAKVPASNAPSWDSFISNLNAYTYGLNDFQEFSAEISHPYKEGSDIEFHIHGATNGQEESDKTIKFEVEYELVDNNTSGDFGDAYTGTTIMEGEITIASGTADKTAWVIDVGIDGTGSFLQGASVVGRIRRIASTGTEPVANPFVIQLGMHIEEDTVGSRTELTK